MIVIGMGISSPYFGARTNLQRVLVIFVVVGVLLTTAFVLVNVIFEQALRAFGKSQESSTTVL